MKRWIWEPRLFYYKWIFHCWRHLSDLRCRLLFFLNPRVSWTTLYSFEFIWKYFASIIPYTQQTRDVDLMLVWCWPANTRRWTNVGLMVAHRLRRWATIKPTSGQRLVLAGILRFQISWTLRYFLKLGWKLKNSSTLAQCWFIEWRLIFAELALDKCAVFQAITRRQREVDILCRWQGVRLP